MVAGLRIVLMRCLLMFLFHLMVYSSTEAGKVKCEKITIPMCKSLNYSMTRFPNRFQHENQKEAALEVHQFWPLIHVGCSSQLKFFLCSLYAPVCNDAKLLPCRSVCKHARKGCIKIMKTYGFMWPEKLNCDLFPEKKDNPLCLAKESYLAKDTSIPTSVVQTADMTVASKPNTNISITKSNFNKSSVLKPTDLTTAVSTTDKSSFSNNSKCEKITIPMCKNFTYNMTLFPNRFQHENQMEAALEMHQFWPLIQLGCSSQLKFFLCSLYAPVCNDAKLLPCRSVCKHARKGCIKIMKTYGFIWPEKLNCDLFPEKKDNPFCLAKESYLAKDTSIPTSVVQTADMTVASKPNTNISITKSNFNKSSVLKPTDLTTAVSTTDKSSFSNNSKCEMITIPMCKNFTYNMTLFPNRFQHENQMEAALEMHQFWPLIQLGCSSQLKFFLCSLYAPVCNDAKLLPCRSVCKHAKKGCRKIMKGFGYKWPKNLKCRLFPRRRNDRFCLLS